MKIDINREYRTRDGKKVRLYAIDGKGDFPIHGATLEGNGWTFRTWSRMGTYHAAIKNHETDLVPYTPPKKTPEEWFQELPSPIRERAIANRKNHRIDGVKYENLRAALGCSFVFVRTPEGASFWEKVSSESCKPESERNYPALPDGHDDFGNVVPAELLPLPEAPTGMKRELRGNSEGPFKDGFYWRKTTGWSRRIADGLKGHLERHYVRLVPEKKYWTEPEHFPAQVWIMRPHWEGCAQITKIDWRSRTINCAGYSGFSFDKLGECRWSESPFKQIKDGKECLVES